MIIKPERGRKELAEELGQASVYDPPRRQNLIDHWRGSFRTHRADQSRVIY